MLLWQLGDNYFIIKRLVCSTTVSSSIDFFSGGIYPAGEGIYPFASGKNLDFYLCTIPTVGLNGNQGEITATHN